MYQVLNRSTQELIAEFTNISDARKKAIEVGGRVKVTSKPR